MKRLAGTLAALVALTSLGAAAQEWPQWRGPQRDGRAGGWNAPAAWPRALRKAWKVNVGQGHASPVVGGGHVYVFARQGEREVLQAYDLALGRGQWTQTYLAPYEMNPAAAGHGKGPKATPVLADGRICTFGISGVLSCHDAASGRLLWRRDFQGRFRQGWPSYGTAQSPLLDGGRLYLHVGTDEDGALIAFDAATGEERWAWRGDGPAYASPVILEAAGERQVVSFTRGQLVGLSAARGELLWKLPFTTPYEQNAVTPLVVGAQVVFSGLEGGVRAVEVVKSGRGWTAQPRWETREVSMYMSSPVLVDGRLYGFSHRNKGEFFALDAATGRLLWRSPGRQGDNASLIAAGGWLLASTTAGELFVQRADGSPWAPVATYPIALTALWSHPAPVPSGLLVKDAEALALWRLD